MRLLIYGLSWAVLICLSISKPTFAQNPVHSYEQSIVQHFSQGYRGSALIQNSQTKPSEMFSVELMVGEDGTVYLIRPDEPYNNLQNRKEIWPQIKAHFPLPEFRAELLQHFSIVNALLAFSVQDNAAPKITSARIVNGYTYKPISAGSPKSLNSFHPYEASIFRNFSEKIKELPDSIVRTDSSSITSKGKLSSEFAVELDITEDGVVIRSRHLAANENNQGEFNWLMFQLTTGVLPSFPSDMKTLFSLLKIHAAFSYTDKGEARVSSVRVIGGYSASAFKQ